MRTRSATWLAALFGGAISAACASPTNPSDSAEGADSSAASTTTAASATPKALPPTAREGSTIARAPQNDALYIADEDHSALRVVPLPLTQDAKVTTIPMPGRPAQIIALDDRVLVTVRDLHAEGVGALVILKRDANLGLNEISKTPLPADAWGIAIAPDASFALISSAWAARVSVVDLAAHPRTQEPQIPKIRATLDVGREPRGITILPDGKRAYVSHLVGSAITRIDALDGPSPRASRLDFPAAPLRAADGVKLSASLGYAVVPSPQGERLFFPRHALGALGPVAWFGTAAVDVWLTRTDAPLVPPPPPRPPRGLTAVGTFGHRYLEKGASEFIQPRAAVYRPRARSLLIASEGTDWLVELDALMTDPTLGLMRSYPLGQKTKSDHYNVATRAGAPSGIALSEDEDLAFVHCRSTDDVVAVRLVQGEGEYSALPPTTVRLVSDPGDESFALGRALFYDATDEITSGGLACAGCHPDGRDDGHVWHEAQFDDDERQTSVTNFIGSSTSIEALDAASRGTGDEACDTRSSFAPVTIEDEGRRVGHARQTPMLAGRVAARGPYGWRSESPSLAARIVAEFGLHRWLGGSGEPRERKARATHLAKFLRKGLVSPPRASRPLTGEEQRGKALFESAETRCATCHVPSSGFAGRAAAPLPQPTPAPGFASEESAAFKTPSLLYVGGTPPYFHDGRYPTLEALVEESADTMGKTSQLSADERRALVAYLKTL